MVYNSNNSFEEQSMDTDSKNKNKSKSFENFSLKKYITARNILSVIGFILLCALYYHAEMSSRGVSKSKEVFTIASHQFTYSSLAGVYTSIMTIILISMVLFYRRFGFYTAMLILTLRTMRLTRTFFNNHYHASMLPAIFTTIAAVVSVLLIYFQYEKMRKCQEVCHQRDVGCKKDTDSPGYDSLFVLDRNQHSQQDSNGAKAEFKTRKHFPISRLNVVVCTSKQLFHRKNLLCF